MTPRQFAKRLEKLADSVEDLCHELAEETLDLIDKGFDDEVDPRGAAWAPRRDNTGFRVGQKRRRGHKILDDTGTLKDSFVIAGVNKNGFGITNDTSYGNYHQEGTTNMVARRMVPRTGDGLGRWAEPLQAVARAFINKKLGIK